MLFDFATEHLLPEHDARQITEPWWPELTSVWTQAWGQYNRFPEEQRAMLALTPYVPPITIFGFAQAYATQIFSGREHEGIVLCPDLIVVGFYINQKVLVRFNAVGSDFVVHNVNSGSDRKELYFGQAPVCGIDNNATRLTVGSVANAAKTDLQCVVVSCQVGNSLHYSFRIDGEAEQSLAGPSASTPPKPGDLLKDWRPAKAR